MTNVNRSLENLQKALSIEMAATHRYLLHARVLDDWGLDLLAAKMREEMDDELDHAGRVIDRILYLDGNPQVAAGAPPRRLSDLSDLFAADLEHERRSIAFYAEAAETAKTDRDGSTRLLFERILAEEKDHRDWLAQQVDLLRRMGEPTYILQHIGDMAASA